ncbi:MAG: bifunctional diguanylate cyclase/phosphodiesterase [Gammaproteobacteria bacterium]|nr:bifunctional diguanylate cyclase/phosphodiesterase [Gammaproteobacteria bacterium]
MKIFTRLSLTLSMLLLTTSVGLMVWATSYTYQSNKLSAIFYERLGEQFNKQSRKHRTQFYQHLNSYNPAVKNYANSNDIKKYIKSEQWLNNKDAKLILHEEVPVWLPRLSIMRSYLWPHYAMLLDKSGKIRELYHYKNPIPPDQLLNITAHELELSRGQSYITMRGQQPFVISAEYIENNEHSPMLVIASPIDEEFMKNSQGTEADDIIIAIIKDQENKILVSSNKKLIPRGTDLNNTSSKYLTTSEDHFDTGSSDLLIKFVSFVSTAEVNQQVSEILKEDFLITVATAVAYISSFSLVMLWITSRIQRLTNRVTSFSKNMEIIQPDIDTRNQLDILENRFESLASAIQSETSALEYQALHDPLTDMPNRKMFNNQLQHQILSSTQTHQKFILILSDLDRFKEINDTLGHHIGDVVLQQVGIRLKETLRSNDMVARLGGDEFGILLSNTTLDQSAIILKKILESFELPFVVEGHNLDIGLSMGVVQFPLHGDDVNILIQRADVAMYNAKSKRTGFSVYESSEDSHAVSRLALASDLRLAISNNALRLFYQPKIDLTTGDIYGAEALLRWEHPERGFISPEDFIPLAEHTGLIQPITCFVIDSAAKQCASWNALGHKLLISVNVSMICIHDAHLPVKLNEMILSNKLSPDQITLELTESIFIKDPVRSKKILNNISAMGVGISIDDFGTGYSSLAYLKQLPVNELKIDQSFVMEMLEDENDAAIVRATIELAHNLGIKVVAEGVESLEVAQQLKILNCNYAQGYYLGRPMEADQFAEYLKSKNFNIDLI